MFCMKNQKPSYLPWILFFFLTPNLTITNGDFESNFEVLKKKIKKPLKVPSLACSVPKPLKVPSLARSVQKPLKVPTVKTANFRQKKGLNPGVESQLVSHRWTCVELISVTLSTIAIIFSKVPNFVFLVFYNFPPEIYTLYPISHPIEGSLRKRGNLRAGYHETSKLLKVCTLIL